MGHLEVRPQLISEASDMPLTDKKTHAGFRTSAAALVTQNFTMPALSPTMTEGNIATWRVKEGETFAAGDVLLEIETDKATMDVEAQDDGIVMKIMQADGSKAVKVGTRIAVLAEAGDDIGSLEIPPDENPRPAQTKEAAKPEVTTPAAESAKPAAPRSSGKIQKQTYPLLPSVAHIMKERGLDESKISEMTPTGPNGRLLKGDVLAYLGTISANVPSDISARFEKLSHLDLSNIKVAKAPEPNKTGEKAAAVEPPTALKELLVTLPISLAAAMEVQKKMEATLGVFMPLSTFIARATEVANDELPLSADAKPTTNELFNQVLGLDKAGPGGSRGFYLPQISALPPASLAVPRPAAKKSDIIDILAGTAARPAKGVRRTVPGVSTGINVFSLAVSEAEEKRAKVFLERVKLVLENEPGRLVL